MPKTREEARRLALADAECMTDEEDAAITAAALADPDNPPWDEHFRSKRGRPKQEVVKEQIALRLDPEVIARFKAGGPGWQTRMSDVLRKAVGLK
jgi:uncharacterized protein (DUF4415 family)